MATVKKGKNRCGLPRFVVSAWGAGGGSLANGVPMAARVDSSLATALLVRCDHWYQPILIQILHHMYVH
jgi:hypothetical protein